MLRITVNWVCHEVMYGMVTNGEWYAKYTPD